MASGEARRCADLCRRRPLTTKELVIAVFTKIDHAWIGHQDQCAIVGLEGRPDVDNGNTVSANHHPISTERPQLPSNPWPCDFPACVVEVDADSFRHGPYHLGRSRQLPGVCTSM